MLTQQQIIEKRKALGIPETGLAPSGVTVQDRLTKLRGASTEIQTQGNQFEQPKEDRSFLEKTRDVATSIIGGGKLAEGLGQAIAAPKLQRELSVVEQQMSDTDLKLVKRIQEKKATGEDTSRLENARNILLEDMKKTRDVQTDFIESLPSNEQVTGSAVRLGATLALPTLTKGIGRTMAPATTVMGGIGKGALVGGATGAIEGAVQGAGVGMEQNKDVGGVVQSSLASAGLGTVGGAVVGGVTGGIMGGINKGKIAKEDFAKEFVMQKQTASVKAQAIQEGRFTDPTFLGKAKITPSKQEEKLAMAVKDIVSPDKTLGQNIDAITSQVDEINTGVKTYIKENKVPFNMNQLRSKLSASKADSKLVFASDATAEKTYDAVIDEFMKQVEKGDTAGLFEARQTFDKVPAIKKLLETQGLGENVKKQIVLDVRRAANEYIAEQLPKGNAYRGLLKLESYMIEAIGNAAERNTNIIGKNGLQLLTDRVPLMKWVLGSAIGGGIAGGVGAGASFIGSSD